MVIAAATQPHQLKVFAVAFQLYDLRKTGYIEREELKEMVLALLHESYLILSDDIIEMIVDKILYMLWQRKSGHALVEIIKHFSAILQGEFTIGSDKFSIQSTYSYGSYSLMIHN
ncbi:calcineurin B-like protein 4 isoform X1 [Nicotiana tabacum]|uniref:Calcineurin B-like protein 4 isoform X1 n=1 Tax=Nicotiana tabacum TaxID=4097 RepID=A0AC58TP18_TOBAC